MARLQAWMMVLLFIGTCMAGCLREEEPSEPQHTWEEPTQGMCESMYAPGFACELLVTGFETPVVSILSPVKDEIWFADLSGNITSFDGNENHHIADLTQVVTRCHYEQGLLGMAFADDFPVTGRILLSYVENGTCDGPPNESTLILAQAIVHNSSLDIETLQVLRAIDQPYRNHNGGHILAIGDNRYLWGVGDGGGRNDPYDNAQNRSTPLGAIHIFSLGNSSINPILENTSGDPYVLHHGLRNPWKFDLAPDGGLWIADVGQFCYEEVNRVELMSPANLGWNTREGLHEFIVDTSGDDCNIEDSEPPEGITDPVVEYGHVQGHCSVTGGHWMDWGPDSLRDGYLYGDYCSGAIWLATSDGEGGWGSTKIMSSNTMIVGFGQGLGDELLIFSWAGEVYSITGV